MSLRRIYTRRTQKARLPRKIQMLPDQSNSCHPQRKESDRQTKPRLQRNQIINPPAKLRPARKKTSNQAKPTLKGKPGLGHQHRFGMKRSTKEYARRTSLAEIPSPERFLSMVMLAVSLN